MRIPETALSTPTTLPLPVFFKKHANRKQGMNEHSVIFFILKARKKFFKKAKNSHATVFFDHYHTRTKRSGRSIGFLKIVSPRDFFFMQSTCASLNVD